MTEGDRHGSSQVRRLTRKSRDLQVVNRLCLSKGEARELTFRPVSYAMSLPAGIHRHQRHQTGWSALSAVIDMK